MNVLTIGSDRKLFERDSAVSNRIRGYGSVLGRMHIIVFSLKHHGLRPVQLEGNIWVYPTNSFSRWLYVYDAVRIAVRELQFAFGAGVDVVTAQDPFESGLAGYLIARRLGRPLQLQVHTDPYSPLFQKSVLNLIRLFVSTQLFKRANCVRVVSQGVKQELEHKYNNLAGKISILPIYVDLDYYRNTSPKFNLHQRYPQFKFIALMVSRLTKEKDFPFALSVFSQVVKEYPKAGLIIVGDGPERHKIEQRAKQLDLYNHVILEGWQGDLVSYYKTANLFLHTSRYEGFGMVLVEAAACGLPIVTSEVGVAVPMKKQERSGVFVCPVGDQDCFVQEVLAFLKDNTRRMLVKFNLENDLRSVTLGSREEYLEAYRQSFESCGRT